MCGKGEVHVEGDMVDDGACAAVVEAHGVYVGDSNTANAVYDDVVFVAVGVDGENAGLTDEVVGRAGIVWVGRRGGRLGIVASAATSSW